MTDRLDIADLAAARFLASSGEGRRIRVAARVSLSELAGEIGVTKASLRRWESGLMVPRGRHAAAYLTALRRIGARQ
jgi:DNA-binding transcriptional regulator YiaG